MTSDVFPHTSAIASSATGASAPDQPDQDAERLSVTGENRFSRLLYAIFLGGVGSIAWSLLVMGSFLLDVPTSIGLQGTDNGWSLLLLVGILLSMRFSATKAFEEDGARFEQGLAVAAAYCVGPSQAGWAMTLALTLEALGRLIERLSHGPRRFRAHLPWLARNLVWSGIGGGIILGVTWLLGAHQMLTRPMGPGKARVSEFGEILQLVIAGVVSMLVLGGLRWCEQRLVAQPRPGRLRALAAAWMSEATLLPLGVLMVLLFHAQSQTQRPIGFALAVVGYLIVAGRFYRLWEMGTMLGRRMVELETLHRSARALAQSFEQPMLIETILRQASAALPEASLLALGLRDHHGTPVFDVFAPAQDRFERVVVASPSATGAATAAGSTNVPARPGVFHTIVDGAAALSIPDLQAMPHDEIPLLPGLPAPRSWLGVPLARYGEVFGVLAAQSEEPNAFAAAHLGLLDALASQAAVALENARLYDLATVDGLTGLYVRRYFDTRLEEEMMRSERFHAPFAVLLMDLDDFKKVNDQHGHAAGDRVLREIAHVVRHRLRGIDIAARYGGEEFAVLLPRTGLTEAAAVAERIRADVAQHSVDLGGGISWRCTVSLGVAVHGESERTEPQALVACADLALYRAKAAGKDRVEIFREEVRAASA